MAYEARSYKSTKKIKIKIESMSKGLGAFDKKRLSILLYKGNNIVLNFLKKELQKPKIFF